MNIKKRSKTKTIVTVVIVAIILFAVGYLLYAKFNHLPPFSLSSPDPGVHTINQEKSEAEKAQTQILKDNPQQKTTNNQTDTPPAPTTSTTTGKQEANAILSFASLKNDTVSAGGYVTNISEEGGSCTYTFTNGSAKVVKTTTTMQNPTSTSCATTNFPASELTMSGTWTVRVAYSSPTASGASNTKEITK